MRSDDQAPDQAPGGSGASDKRERPPPARAALGLRLRFRRGPIAGGTDVWKVTAGGGALPERARAPPRVSAVGRGGPAVKLTVETDVFPLAKAFTISRGSRTEARVLTVTVEAGGTHGRGECVPYARYGETMESVRAQVLSLPPMFDRAALQDLLPPGAARNAVDCALWDWEAKSTGRRAWQLAGLTPCRWNRPRRCVQRRSDRRTGRS